MQIARKGPGVKNISFDYRFDKKYDVLMKYRLGKVNYLFGN